MYTCAPKWEDNFPKNENKHNTYSLPKAVVNITTLNLYCFHSQYNELRPVPWERDSI